MVDNRHDGVRRVSYLPAADDVEVYTLRELIARAGPDEFADTQRLDFHALLVVDGGEAQHVVDFAQYSLRRGSVLWIRPGMAQRWGEMDALDGHVVLFRDGLVAPRVDTLAQVGCQYAPRWWQLPDRTYDRISAHVANMHHVAHSTLPDELRRATSGHLLSALVLGLAGTLGAEPTDASVTASPVFTEFRNAVEENYMRLHAVADYATLLGYSSRTLARATRESVGKSPKAVLDERILLEARRRLAHTDIPVARIGAALGFPDASNFGSWFTARANTTPSAFRRRG
ncbi:helix-turn-helix domain-containing protein [Rhodococcus sp. HNM0569]|uniref:AraC family transcriptional regulator n=1 Tax=Rhodococcus sp. HNM0569 TaxID=2716340 RepID=UPI00146B6444|nr:helix-turn-helix domain-containing protein [Rhodococcus sp. HNM0569]NLU84318.1 AraC family transcriptional regulator [Rhodococcus sp. HNM0569]